MKKIAVFVGTRPEGIKMAPVIAALRQAPDLEPIVVSTGQHREMLQQVVDLFQITVDHDLAVMQPNQTLASLTARLMTRIDELLDRIEPDMALVQGDTTTVLVASLACFYRRIPIGHVEAGLRTGNIWSPFPEEVNRRLASPLVTLHFPPTEFGRANLLKEGVADKQIRVTGNTVIDALQMEVQRQQDPQIKAKIDQALAEEVGRDWDQVPYVLVTGHRRENFGQGFEQICDALADLADRFPDHRFIYPVHLNPQVQAPVQARLGDRRNIKLITPRDYRTFVALMSRCRLVLTDSGGVQEEAPGLGKPVLVMRDTTERPEGVEAGTVQLVGADRARIVEAASELLTDRASYDAMAEAVNPYGDGQAAERILDRIREHFAELVAGASNASP
ncbi:non-hydrolyzing UDP-N-acetylglucosamine 2-epimerase [Phycisphaerales bacterium AB-hyl4]|uniref:UDP-N-acetylglucosamine 2-epimerase (non-hydrolyzing) n=1 Tax=Natronomicrosphaera hydrolytica TaxID=3242702 RepID=A0ABV4U7H8_9BACT